MEQLGFEGMPRRLYACTPTRLSAVPTLSTTLPRSPSGKFAGIRALTWRQPTNPGASPA